MKPFYADVLLVCVDCQGWQSTAEVRTSEIGITIADTRDLHCIPIGQWNKRLSSLHFRMTTGGLMMPKTTARTAGLGSCELMTIRPNKYDRTQYYLGDFLSDVARLCESMIEHRFWTYFLDFQSNKTPYASVQGKSLPNVPLESW